MPKVKVNGVGIAYEVRGQGEPLVMIQGLGSPRIGWFFQKSAFSRHFRVVMMDNRGVGKSDKPTDAYTVRDMADDVMGLMDHLGIDKAHIMGASMGGMIAQEIAINYPDRVNKLVLVCTTPGINDTVIRMEQQKALGLGDGSTETDLDNLDWKGMGTVMRNVVGLSFNRRLPRLFFIPISKLYFRSEKVVRGIIGQIKAVADHNTLDRLNQIKASTLVIAGTEDKILSPISSDIIAEHISNARLVKIDGGSHSFFIERMGEFNKEVISFLKEK
jgi:pimeloyl-ACP methyl ester carboxylesterase